MAGRRDICIPSICLSLVSQVILGSQFLTGILMNCITSRNWSRWLHTLEERLLHHVQHLHLEQRILCHHPSWLQVLPSHQLCPQYSAAYQSMLVSSRATELSREWSSKAWSRIYIPARIGQPPGKCRCVSADDSFQKVPPHFSRQKLLEGSGWCRSIVAILGPLAPFGRCQFFCIHESNPCTFCSSIWRALKSGFYLILEVKTLLLSTMWSWIPDVVDREESPLWCFLLGLSPAKWHVHIITRHHVLHLAQCISYIVPEWPISTEVGLVRWLGVKWVELWPVHSARWFAWDSLDGVADPWTCPSIILLHISWSSIQISRK